MIEDSLRADLRDQISIAVAIGVDDFDTIVDAGADHLHGQADPRALRAAAAEITGEEFAAHRSRQRTWPDVLDADLLVRAFRDLDMAGIVARADFTCCQNCGTAEISGEVLEGTRVRGYTFCHRQDVEAGVRGEGVHLSYGTFGTGDAVEVAQEVVAALRGCGLTVHWDGDPARRIHVPLTWQRRRTGRLAAWAGGGAARNGVSALRVTWCDYVRRMEDRDVRMSFAEARQCLFDLVPRDGNFIAFESGSGRVLQAMWQAGPELWLESPDVAAQCSRGRHVTLAEAEELLRILATEGRLVLERLGDLETVAWSAG
jgi:uncharacterized protein DUF6891